MNYQLKISEWMEKTFSQDYKTTNPDDAHHSHTRILRFMEEAIELFQAEGLSREKFNEVADYVWNRPQGQINQEVGGVMVTLTAYCISKNIDLMTEGWREFYRIDTEEMRAKIRKKQEEKPNGLPAPYVNTCGCDKLSCPICMPF